MAKENGKSALPGASKRRTWRKLHLGVDEATLEILAAVVTANDVADCEVLPQLLDVVAEDIAQVTGDGAYDTKDCYDAIDQREATATMVVLQKPREW